MWLHNVDELRLDATTMSELNSLLYASTVHRVLQDTCQCQENLAQSSFKGTMLYIVPVLRDLILPGPGVPAGPCRIMLPTSQFFLSVSRATKFLGNYCRQTDPSQLNGNAAVQFRPRLGYRLLVFKLLPNATILVDQRDVSCIVLILASNRYEL